MDSNLHTFMEKPSRQLAAEQNNGPLCHNDKKKLPTAFGRNGVVISTITASEWCVDDGETHENAHQYVSSPLQVVVTKCEDPLRQFHHSKDGVLVTSTCNASEWCITHVESHGTHVNPHLDQSWTNQHPNGHWSALCERKRPQFNGKRFPLQQSHPDSTRRCRNHSATHRSRVVCGGSDNHLQHIAIDQWTQLAHVHRKGNAFAAK